MTWLIAPSAEACLEEIIADLRRRGRDVRAFEQDLRKAMTRILAFPKHGREVPEFQGSAFREFTVPPYRFFYSVDEATKKLWLVDVWHRNQVPKHPHMPAAAR